ncbi:IncP-type conjugal transfer protein TrbI [Rhizobium mesosinicum]|uniref:IncP-type conjugal transfer protein TrbI n=1 Tax=Rhizobium mesosinicum TaxID=335017 RepID=A0ABS7GZ82_9HYPH|nr:IncP-type conjugal transfer protein TrbI [Rhizobium mesosinicum]MBW9054598.1 IncP-type conjugal transfer protein TrbI [Rhizobium mesosinicum]
MAQSLQLGHLPEGQSQPMRRLSRLPVLVTLGLILIFFAVIIFGLAGRGFYGRQAQQEDGTGIPASNYADQLKRGIQDGIIGEPEPADRFKPQPPETAPNQLAPEPPPVVQKAAPEAIEPESDDVFEARLAREGRERYLREIERRRMARLQAAEAALDSPLQVDVTQARVPAPTGDEGEGRSAGRAPAAPLDLYQAALEAGSAGQNADPNKQLSKEDFFNGDIKELGYLPNRVVPQLSPYELKRGSVIPATLISGINSDLPGRISAQVSQNVYDSATGNRLLIPQGAKLFGRYDSKIAFGQARVLVVWTDLIFPNGQTLQIGGMAGTDAEGYGGFRDRVGNHTLRTFGSAALIALIGTGIDASIPESSTRATEDTASDAARRNFAESFGRVAERTIDKNLNVQPTLQIRPGYRFNLLVDQDIVFPGAYPAF